MPGANPLISERVRLIAPWVRYMVTPSQLTRAGRDGSNPACVEPAGQGVALEIQGHEAHAVRHGDPGRREAIAFPLLGAGVIDLEDRGRQFGAVGKRVQARAEDHILAHAVAHAGGQVVLGETAPAEHLSPGAGQHEVRAVRPVIAKEFLCPLTEQGGRELIGEDDRLAVDEQVGGPGSGGGQGRLAGLVTGP